MAYLKELFDYCIKSDMIPMSWKETRLILVPKEGNNIENPGSYRPIALLNLDYKILSSILEERLNRIINNYIQ